MEDIEIIYTELGRLTKQVRDLEARVEKAERIARDAQADCQQMKGRIWDLEVQVR